MKMECEDSHKFAKFELSKNPLEGKPKYIKIGGRLLDITIPRVMGIINVTPDSFYKGSRATDEKEIIARAETMFREGADFIDVGGYSSRPDAKDIPAEEEKKRVLSAIQLIKRELPDAAISIDTFRSEVAQEAVEECGAQIINDISGGEGDKNMFKTIIRLNVPYIMMHMQGTPATMQKNPEYNDVVSDILKWFSIRIDILRSSGVNDIIIDPGFGFGKTREHNFELLSRLEEFNITGLPLLVGLSRKSMIWKTLDIDPEEALNGTTVLNTIALLNGADILRVHDVREAVQAIGLVEKMKHHKIK